MSVLVSTIKTINWSMSINQQGKIVTDIDAINQCILIILTTIIGTDSLRPLFGCNLYNRIDLPITTAIPLMIKDIKDAINTYETRVTVTNVSYQFDGSVVTFVVSYVSNFGNSFVALPVTIA